MYEPTATVVYRDAMVAPRRDGYSRSPMKPRLWLEHVRQTALSPRLRLDGGFGVVSADDLRLAHTPEYVAAFLGGRPRALAASAGNGWSKGYRDSVLVKVGALVHAGRAALERPSRLVVCPTSGDHHARPEAGSGFCPIAGQVIAAKRLFAERGVRTAWVDLDEHYGNSIPDCAARDPRVRDAIPLDINPVGVHAQYLADLTKRLRALEKLLLAGRVDLVCIGHGADSHEWDQLGGSVSTEEWVEAARLTYAAVRRAAHRLGRPVPVVTSFFGGYRDDDYGSVLELHTANVATGLDVLGQAGLRYRPRVRRPARAVAP